MTGRPQDSEKSFALWAGAAALKKRTLQPVLLLGAPFAACAPPPLLRRSRAPTYMSSYCVLYTLSPDDHGIPAPCSSGADQQICNRNTKPRLAERGVAVYRLVSPSGGGAAEGGVGEPGAAAAAGGGGKGGAARGAAAGGKAEPPASKKRKAAEDVS